LSFFDLVILEKNFFFNFIYLFIYFTFLFLVVYLNNFEFPLPKDDLYTVSLKLACWFWRRFLNDLTLFFFIVVLVSPLNRTWPFIWTIMNSLYLRMICKQFHWNWSAGSGEDFFFNFQCIFTLPWNRGGVPLIWTILNSLYVRMICANFGYNWPSSFGKM
jgi:hypothetical protein